MYGTPDGVVLATITRIFWPLYANTSIVAPHLSMTLNRASYAISKPRTLLSHAGVARVCFSQCLISASYLDARGHSTCASSRRRRGAAIRHCASSHHATLTPIAARHPPVTLDPSSYALSGPCTPTRANSVRACRSPSPICGPSTLPTTRHLEFYSSLPCGISRKGIVEVHPCTIIYITIVPFIGAGTYRTSVSRVGRDPAAYERNASKIAKP